MTRTTSNTWELATGELSRECLHKALDSIIGLLASHGEQSVVFEIGWGASIPINELWSESVIDLKEVVNRVEEGERQALFRLGNTDIILKCATGETLFCFSHHDSVQMQTRDFGLLQQVRSEWAHSGFALFDKDKGGQWQAVE